MTGVLNKIWMPHSVTMNPIAPHIEKIQWLGQGTDEGPRLCPSLLLARAIWPVRKNYVEDLGKNPDVSTMAVRIL